LRDLRTLGLICLVEVIKYFFAAYAPPVIANTKASVAITAVGLTCNRLRSAENILATSFSQPTDIWRALLWNEGARCSPALTTPLLGCADVLLVRASRDHDLSIAGEAHTQSLCDFLSQSSQAPCVALAPGVPLTGITHQIETFQARQEL
jgi:hypothetical protein